MSLKDWKKVKTKDPKFLFKKNKHEVEIQLRKIRGMGYRVCLDDKCKYFKTKPQALKYAKSYMRKH